MAQEDKSIVIQQITVGQLYRQREDIETWLQAVKSAESVNYPRWKRLIEIYERTVLDLVVTSSVRKRIQEVTNTELHYLNVEGEHDEQMQSMVARPWFQKLLRYILESRFWGHSLMEPVGRAGEVVDLNLIPRHHVDRIKGLVLRREFDLASGIPYREGRYARHLLEVGEARDLGLLSRVAPYVLYKQGGMADWSHFAELFGMPTRIYKYNPHDPTSRQEVEKQAQTQGSAAYIIVPEGVSMDFQEASNATGSSDMYDGLRRAMNEEIVIGILGNNLTTSNSTSGTYALGDVHQDEQQRIHADDLAFVESVLNHQATAFLQYWGLPLKPGYSFAFDRSERLSMAQRIDLDTKVNAVAPIDPAYFYERYGVPPAPETAPDPDPEPETPPEPEPDPPGKPEDQRPGAGAVVAYPEAHAHGCCSVMAELVPTAFSRRLARLWVKMLDRVYQGHIPAGRSDRDNLKEIGETLFGQGFKQGFGTYELEDAQYLATVHKNLFTFAGAKNLAELTALRDLVYKNGKKIPFTEFRAEAKKLWKNYREDWLRTEYNQVVRAGTMGQQWRDLERTKRLYPYLRYVTENDGRVRPEHVVLHDTIRPIDDDFWLTYYPPNGWNCRCSVRKVSQAQIDSGKYELTPGTDALERGRNAGVQNYWKGNVGKTGMVFRASGHTYFQNLKPDEVAHIDKVARYWRDLNPITREAGYVRKYENPDTKGWLEVHVDADTNNDELQGNTTLGVSLANQGHQVRVRPHVQSPYGDNGKNPDMEVLLDGKWIMADRKTPDTNDPVNIIQNALDSALAQSDNKDIIPIVVLSRAEQVRQYRLERAINGMLIPGRKKNIPEIWILYPDGRLGRVNRKMVSDGSIWGSLPRP